MLPAVNDLSLTAYRRERRVLLEPLIEFFVRYIFTYLVPATAMREPSRHRERAGRFFVDYTIFTEQPHFRPAVPWGWGTRHVASHGWLGSRSRPGADPDASTARPRPAEPESHAGGHAHPTAPARPPLASASAPLGASRSRRHHHHHQEDTMVFENAGTL